MPSVVNDRQIHLRRRYSTIFSRAPRRVPSIRVPNIVLARTFYVTILRIHRLNIVVLLLLSCNGSENRTAVTPPPTTEIVFVGEGEKIVQVYVTFVIVVGRTKKNQKEIYHHHRRCAFKWLNIAIVVYVQWKRFSG